MVQMLQLWPEMHSNVPCTALPSVCAAATRQWNCWAGGWHETCFMSPLAALTHNKRNVFSVGRLRDCLDIVSIMSAIMVSIFSNFLLLSLTGRCTMYVVVVDIFIQY